MYSIVVSRSAEKDLEKLPSQIVKRVGKAIDELEITPKPPGSKKLKATTENLWRIRVGDYRIIYSIDDNIYVVDIRKVGHRKDIYNK